MSVTAVDGCLRLMRTQAGSEAARDYADDFSAARTDTDANLAAGPCSVRRTTISLFQNPLTLLQRSADTKARQRLRAGACRPTLYAGNDTGTKLLSTVASDRAGRKKDLRHFCQSGAGAGDCEFMERRLRTGNGSGHFLSWTAA